MLDFSIFGEIKNRVYYKWNFWSSISDKNYIFLPVILGEVLITTQINVVVCRVVSKLGVITALSRPARYTVGNVNKQ